MDADGDDPYQRSGFRVEAAASQDWISIAHLNVWAYREFAVDLGPEAWPDLVRTLTSIGERAKIASFFVARSDEGLVGSVAYHPPGRSTTPLPAEWASINLLAVAPPARGRGVAASLVEACTLRAEQHGAPSLGAVVAGYLADAQGLFTWMGFRREQGLPRRGEEPYWLYRKDLG